MNRDDIIRLAQEALLPSCHLTHPKALERFAALVAAAEREACAQFIEHDYVRQFERPWRVDLSAAIRARGEK